MSTTTKIHRHPRIALHLPASLLRRLRTVAKQRRSKISAEVRRWIEQGVEAAERKPD